MSRILRTLTALLLIFTLSLSAAFAAGEASQSAGSAQVQSAAEGSQAKSTRSAAGVVKIKGSYYYKDPKTGKIRKKAGFVNWNGSMYYIGSDGKLRTSGTFKVGKHHYRAYKDGRIAVGIYRWGKDRKLYYSDPKNGRWVTIKSHSLQKGVKWKGNWYYLQTGSEVAVNRPVVINNLPYFANSEGICTPIEIRETKNPVLKIARNQVGKHTKAQVGGFWTWFFGTRFMDTDRTPWCGTFVGWCFKKAGKYKKISAIGDVGYVPRYTSFANRKSKWIKKSKAKGGDIIVFGKFSRHVGIVENVCKGYVFTIEGNSGPTSVIGSGKPGAVTRRVHKLTDKDIKGIIRP